MYSSPYITWPLPPKACTLIRPDLRWTDSTFGVQC